MLYRSYTVRLCDFGNFIRVCYIPLDFGLGEIFMSKDKIK